MPILDKNSKDELAEYNVFLKANNGLAMQDLKWAKLKSDWLSEVVYLRRNGEICAGMTLLLKKLPFFNSYLAYASRGPVCDINDIELVKDLIAEANDLLTKKYKVFVLKFDPEIIANEQIRQLYLDSGFRIIDNNQTIQPRFNMIINLASKTAEELKMQFHKKTRYNIGLAERHGVTVRYSNSIEDLKVFYELYKITAIRDKISCREFDYFKCMLDVFDENEIRIYIASHDGDNLSAAIALNYGGKMFYIYGASSNEKRKLMPNYLMQWEMILWALECGCTQYDLGGVKELSDTHGLYKFKSGFCANDGVTEFIGEIDKVYKPSIYFIYQVIVPKIQELKRAINKLKLKNT